MTYVEWSDIARTYVAVLAVLLVVLFVRLAFIRARRNGWGIGSNPHPFASLGIAMTLAAVAIAHYESFGKPASWRFWVVVVGYTLTTLGMGMAVRWRRPSRRDAAPRDS